MTDLQRVRIGRILRGYAVILAMFAGSAVLTGGSAWEFIAVFAGAATWTGLVLVTPERWLWSSPLFAGERWRLRGEGSLPTQPASAAEVAAANARYLDALKVARDAGDAAAARDVATAALRERPERSFPPDTALLELALQHVSRSPNVENARNVAARALAISGELETDGER